jgi:hypothetical protein
MRPMWSWLAVLALCAGCYTPELAPCTVRCRASEQCPDGFACLDDRFCHAGAEAVLCPCKPLRCDEVPGACGELDDTCGGVTRCGDCTGGLVCGGGGTPNVCGDPASCVPLACEPDACGPSVDSCNRPRTCPDCPAGEACRNGSCQPCTPACKPGELACGDDGCGGSCGTCPDARWTCHDQGVCCIRNGERCNPFLEGCNCCPGLFCISGFCEPAAGCAMAADRSWPVD